MKVIQYMFACGTIWRCYFCNIMIGDFCDEMVPCDLNCAYYDEAMCRPCYATLAKMVEAGEDV